MKRHMALAIGLVLAMAAPAAAIPGDEPASSSYELRVMNGSGQHWYTWHISRAPDAVGIHDSFGDRFRYRCAWNETYDANHVLLAETYFLRYGPADPDPEEYRIIDAGGEELPEPQVPQCRIGSADSKLQDPAIGSVYAGETRQPGADGTTIDIQLAGTTIRSWVLPATSPLDPRIHFQAGDELGEAIMYLGDFPVGKVLVKARAPDVTISQS